MADARDSSTSFHWTQLSTPMTGKEAGEDVEEGIKFCSLGCPFGGVISVGGPHPLLLRDFSQLYQDYGRKEGCSGDQCQGCWA